MGAHVLYQSIDLFYNQQAGFYMMHLFFSLRQNMVCWYVFPVEYGMCFGPFVIYLGRAMYDFLG